jgi:xylulokinase
LTIGISAKGVKNDCEDKAMKRYIIGIDIGTSGCKALLADERGAILASDVREYPLYTPRSSWSEQEPDDWWRACTESIAHILIVSGIDPACIAAVGLSGQMHGLVALDEKGSVIRRAILWNDQRTAKQCAEITEKAGGLRKLIEMVNNPVLPGYTAGKILWLKENEPELYSRIFKMLNPKDYIRYKLTGNFATDVSDASGTGLFDVEHKRWSGELLSMLEISSALLPKVYESCEITGYLSAEAARETGLPEGLPVAGGGGDAVIQTTGTGLIRQGILGTTIGTSGIVAMALDGFKPNVGGSLQVFCNNMPGKWHAMGVTLSAGGSYKWLRDILYVNEKKQAENTGGNIYNIMDEVAGQAAPGSGGILFMPYLTGERCPYPDPDASGCFIGLSIRHGRSEMTRSVLEGVIYSLRQVSELISDINGGNSITEIRTSGGGSMSSLWRQIQADIFQIPVKTVSGSAEGGAYGAVFSAGVACGIWKSMEEAVSFLKTETETWPNTKNRAIYEELYGVYKSMYPALKNTFGMLAGI